MLGCLLRDSRSQEFLDKRAPETKPAGHGESYGPPAGGTLGGTGPRHYSATAGGTCCVRAISGSERNGPFLAGVPLGLRKKATERTPMTWHMQEAAWLDPLLRTPPMATAVWPARPLSPAARLKMLALRPAAVRAGPGCRPAVWAKVAEAHSRGRATLANRGGCGSRAVRSGSSGGSPGAPCQRTQRAGLHHGGSHPGRRLDANATSFNKPLVSSRCPQGMRGDLDPSLRVPRKTNTSLQLNPTWGPPKRGA